MADSDILIQGAREHNLRDVNLVLPRNRLICFTGVSGSGKSSLAFDTLYAEGQRRVCGKPFQLRPAVLGPDAQAGRRPDRRPEPFDLDLAEVQRHEPPLDGGHDYRDLRLPPRALRPRRQGALSGVRPPDHCADAGADHRPHYRAPVWHAVHGAGAADPRAEGRVPRPVRGPAQARFRPRPRRRADCSPDRQSPPGPADAAQYRGRHRPARRRAEAPYAAGRSGGDGAAVGRWESGGGEGRRRT